VQALFVDVVRPGGAHRAFCDLPFETVVTTNFEFLLERGYLGANRQCIPLVNEDQLSIGSGTAGVRLLKVHGDLHHPTRMVVTEEDYDGFLSRYPLIATYLASLLVNNTALFVGYSLDDPDFRQVWQVIKDWLGGLRRPAYVIQIAARPNAIARYERRGVKVINLPASKKRTYGEIFEIAFRELLVFWTAQTLKRSTATEDEQQAELLLPLEARGRLCFLMVPTRLSAFYKSLVYPIVESHGLSPVMAVDVVAPGDSVMAKVSALIERAVVIVADVSTANTLFELRMATSRAEGKHLIAITDRDTPIPSDLSGISFMYRPEIGSGDYGAFLQGLDSRLAEIASDLQPTLESEPQRLLQKHEYRAAVVAAFGSLEHQLRKLLAERDPNSGVSRGSLGRLLDTAFRMEILPANERARMREWLMVRNSLVHEGANVSASEARRIVSEVLSLEGRLRRLTSR
jgi:hypothetical protein